MKTLADRILALIPATTHGLSLRVAVEATRQSQTHVRAAFETLNAARRAKLVKRGAGGALYLVRPDIAVTVCVVCHTEFEPPAVPRTDNRGVRRSRRKTCSAKCHAALGWLAHPEKRDARRKALSAAQSTPKALARTAAHNARRWADPEQHRRLSEQNRERARMRREDPEAFERYRAMMRIIQSTPEKKKLYSEIRKRWWADPVMRKKMTDAVNASEAVQEYRRNFGEHNKRRWQNPALREKYTKANRARNTPELKAKSAARLKAVWEDPVRSAQIRAKIKASMSTPEYRTALSARMKAAHQDKEFQKKYRAGVKRARKQGSRNVPTFEGASA